MGWQEQRQDKHSSIAIERGRKGSVWIAVLNILVLVVVDYSSLEINFVMKSK